MTAYRKRFIYRDGLEVYPWEVVMPDDDGIISIIPDAEVEEIQIKAFDDQGKEQRMSYIRFGENNSDVYVYLCVDGGIECCDCAMLDRCFHVNSAEAMAQHLRDHIQHGHVVPDGVIDRIIDNANFDPTKDRPNALSPLTTEPSAYLPPAG